MVKTTVVICILILLAGTAAFSAVNPAGKEDAALAAAQAWLKQVDNGKYAESWAAAADIMRAKVPKEQWMKTMETQRKPFGALVKREQKSSWYKAAIPGAPPGEYVILQFETAFSNGKPVSETVTPMLEKDGKWRVSGYYVKEAGGEKLNITPAPMRKK